MNKRVAIIGSGTAGASVAIYLHKLGYEVTVFERETTPKPVGAGIMLQPTGLNTLADLGLKEKALTLGTPIYGMTGITHTGKKIIDISFENKYGLYGLGMHRSALYFLLFNELLRLNIPVKLGTEIISINNKEKTVSLTDSNSNTYTQYDWIIVANGARSLLRENIVPIKKSAQQNFGALWAKIPFHNDFFKNHIHQKYEGSHKMIGFMPIGKAAFNEEEYVNFFWSINMKEVEKWKKQSLEDWKTEALALAPDFKEVIDKIQDKSQLTLAPYMDVVLNPSFCNNVIFIGDAAHPMSPQLSQGASFALLDARILAEKITEHPQNTERAFKQFQKERAKQVNYFQNVSRQITPLFQSETKNTWFRDVLFKLLIGNKLSRNILISTILGYRQNSNSLLHKKYFLPK